MHAGLRSVFAPGSAWNRAARIVSDYVVGSGLVAIHYEKKESQKGGCVK